MDAVAEIKKLLTSLSNLCPVLQPSPVSTDVVLSRDDDGVRTAITQLVTARKCTCTYCGCAGVFVYPGEDSKIDDPLVLDAEIAYQLDGGDGYSLRVKNLNVCDVCHVGVTVS